MGWRIIITHPVLGDHNVGEVSKSPEAQGSVLCNDGTLQNRFPSDHFQLLSRMEREGLSPVLRESNLYVVVTHCKWTIAEGRRMRHPALHRYRTGERSGGMRTHA